MKGFKEIVLDTFAGRENFDDQTVIDNSTMASASFNVWAPNKVLTKSPGVTIQCTLNSATSSGVVNSINLLVGDNTVSPSYQVYARTSNLSSNNYLLWGSPNNPSSTSWVPLGYTVGTISVSGANLISATGNGTSWSTNVTAGDVLIINSTSSARHTILSVEDNTHLTLSTALATAVAVGSTYVAQQGLYRTEIAVASLNGLLSMVTTADIMQQYDGTNVLKVSAAPSVAFLAVFKNYQFGFRSNTATSRLYWSALKDPTSWPTNNFQDIDINNGVGTGIFPYGNELILFKSNGMYKFLGDTFDPANPTYILQKISTPADFVFDSNYTCAIHQGWLVFYGHGRFYRYLQGMLFVQDIGKHIIRDLPSSFGITTDAHGNVDQQVWGLEYNDFYLCGNFLNISQNVQQSFLLDSKWKWFYFKSGIDSGSWPNCLRPAIVPDVVSRPKLLLPNQSTTNIYLMDLVGPTYGTNDYSLTVGPGTPQSISSQWTSKEINIEFGTFLWAIVYIQKQSAGTLTFSYAVDQGSLVSNSIDMTSGVGQVLRFVQPIQQKGKTIQFQITHNTVNQTFKLYAVKLVYDNSAEERIV